MRTAREGDSTCGEPSPRGLARLDVCVRGANTQDLQPGSCPRGCSLPSWFGPRSGAFPTLAATGQSELLARGPSLPLAPRASESSRAALARPQTTRLELHPFLGIAGRNPVPPEPWRKIKFLGFFGRRYARAFLFYFYFCDFSEIMFGDPNPGPESTSEVLAGVAVG